MDAPDPQDTIARLDSPQLLDRVRAIVDRTAARVACTRSLVAHTGAVLRRQQQAWAGEAERA